MSFVELLIRSESNYNGIGKEESREALGRSSHMLLGDYLTKYADEKQHESLVLKPAARAVAPAAAPPALCDDLDEVYEVCWPPYANDIDQQPRAAEGLRYRTESFRALHEGVVDGSASVKEKCAWLRSQLVGEGVEFDTPFGKRLLTYADHTASGRSLHHIENYIVQKVLPFYEEREDAGTPAIVQKIRAALAFWVKEYMGYHLIDSQESLWLGRALKRLLSNPNVIVLGNTKAKRQPIVSFLVRTTSSAETTSSVEEGAPKRGVFMWSERATRMDKPLHGRFVTKLLNDLFGIQARGGCSCAGPYGHALLEVGPEKSLAFRSAIRKGYNGLKPGWTRISFSYFISHEEFEFMLAAIEFIAIYGQRFLPLYRFNWKTGDWTFGKSAINSILKGSHEPAGRDARPSPSGFLNSNGTPWRLSNASTRRTSRTPNSWPVPLRSSLRRGTSLRESIRTSFFSGYEVKRNTSPFHSPNKILSFKPRQLETCIR
ncbi:hypothetical protein EJ110_NYTH10136 [Nymphaea thermarum]|nr:hypothetical protein EJ110_NYTH10136 [Nymphaea thermarum]